MMTVGPHQLSDSSLNYLLSLFENRIEGIFLNKIDSSDMTMTNVTDFRDGPQFHEINIPLRLRY